MHSILHFCGMLSSTQESDMARRVPHDSPWSGLHIVRSLTDMHESNADGDRDEYLSRLGVVLQLARKHAKLSQEAAATKMGLSPATFTRWEAGDTAISAYDLVRLVRLYELDPDLAFNPPASRVEIRRRLGPVSAAARRAVRRAQLRPLPLDEGERG